MKVFAVVVTKVILQSMLSASLQEVAHLKHQNQVLYSGLPPFIIFLFNTMKTLYISAMIIICPDCLPLSFHLPSLYIKYQVIATSNTFWQEFASFHALPSIQCPGSYLLQRYLVLLAANGQLIKGEWSE